MMSMFHSLSFREAVKFPSHLYTDTQVDVTLHTYIPAVLFTNVWFLFGSTEAHVSDQYTNSIQWIQLSLICFTLLIEKSP